MRVLERPFWLAGEYGSPERLAAALEAGAAGIQVGTAFAFCAESGLGDDVKRRVLEMARAGRLDVRTDPKASPTGYGTLSDSDKHRERLRVCDIGYLRQAYARSDDTIGWRCPGEKIASYVQKGGDASHCEGRKCLCNSLLANVGLGQVREDGESELPLITCGDDVGRIAEFADPEVLAPYPARDVVAKLLGRLKLANSLKTALAV
jgi:nitronate monooxygenase